MSKKNTSKNGKYGMGSVNLAAPIFSNLVFYGNHLGTLNTVNRYIHNEEIGTSNVVPINTKLTDKEKK